ncbi:hypothetical protein DIPPA_11276 [Diplonema papillatum]|nr:hypothetical protein DIPPA_11276 [Diplonema papillatum]
MDVVQTPSETRADHEDGGTETASVSIHGFPPSIQDQADQGPQFWPLLKTSFARYRRTFVMALTLFLVGMALLVAGIFCAVKCDNEHYIIFLVLGALVFLPGSYGLFVFVQHARRVNGYDPQELSQTWEKV